MTFTAALCDGTGHRGCPSHCAPNVPRPPTSLLGTPLLETPFLILALPETLVPEVTPLLRSRAGYKPGVCEPRS